jgi:uncharacterized membrane protein YeaQ/YmgE (transglycosylase-associated protein family)
MDPAALDIQLPAPLDLWAQTVLVWVGFGTLVGLAAKAIMPGRDPGGAIVTLSLGVGGTIVGCGVLSLCLGGHLITPISPLGMGIGTLGAFILLFFYRLLGGYWFVEGDHARRPSVAHVTRPRPVRRRRRREYAYDDE